MPIVVACTLALASVLLMPVPAPAADSLAVRNGTIVTMDAEKRVIEDGVVIIDGARITAVGGEALLAEHEPERVIDARGGIVMPGMINLHNHLSMVAFRGLGENAVANRLFEFFFPLEKALLERELIHVAARHAAIESALAGVTTVTDMYYHEDEVARALKQVGLRGVLGETIIGFPVVDAENPDEGLAYAERFIREYRDDPLITPAVAPHAPYTVSPPVLLRAKALADRYEVPLLMHVAELPDEKARTEEAFDAVPREASIIEYLAWLGILDENLVAAHVIHVDAADIALLARHGVGIAHNPRSNTKAVTGLAPAWEMHQQGLRIGLGTDGPMSANQMDMLSVMPSAARVARIRYQDSTRFTPAELVEMVTTGGARALGMAAEIGSLEPGKLADVVVLDTGAPNMQPVYDVYATIVFSAYPADVRTTIVHGEVLVDEHRIRSVDMARHQRQWRGVMDRVAAFARTLD